MLTNFNNESDLKFTEEEFLNGTQAFIEGEKAQGNVEQIIKIILKDVTKTLGITYKQRIDEFKGKGKVREFIDLIRKNIYNYGDLKLIGLEKQVTQKISIECEKTGCYINNRVIEFQELLEKSPLIILNWSAEEGWALKNATKNIKKLTGHSDTDFLSGKLTFSDIIHEDDKERIKEEVEKFTGEKMENFEQNYKIVCKNGDIKDIYDKTLVKYGEDGKILNLYGYIYDITEEKKTEEKLNSSIEELNYLIYNDRRTGLPNLKSCEEFIEKRGIEHFVTFKIDDFSQINSLFGRISGEKILDGFFVKFSKKIKKLGKENGYNMKLFRTDGLECGITIENGDGFVTSLDVIEGIDSIMKEINETKEYKGIKFFLKHSMAGAFYETEDIIEKTQVTLSKLKENNKDGAKNHLIYSYGLEEKLKKEQNSFFSCINRIREDLKLQEDGKDGNLKVFHQGIRNNKNGKIKKYESLIRLYDEEKNIIVPPFKFLGHIKKAKLMNELTNFIVDRNINLLEKNKDIDISINITMEDLSNSDFIDGLISKVISRGIDPQKIILEILEDISVIDGTFYEAITFLESQGFKIAIDDFGSGFSNFERLIRLKPDFLKIDGSLIDGIAHSKEQMDIVESIVKIAHGMGAEVIAEFIEDKQTQAIVEKLGVDYSQGYLFSKPEERFTMNGVQNENLL